jgi:Leucine-rich repeat (LRR) protein
MLGSCRSCDGKQRTMKRHQNYGGNPQAVLTILFIGGLLGLVGLPSSASAQEKSKSELKDQKPPEVKATPRDEKKVDSKPTLSVPANADDPVKLKEQITGLQKEVAILKLRVATLEFEKLGAIVTVDKAKDGKETATVNILKKWSGDKDSLQLLKKIPNLQVVYIDNAQVNDMAVTPLKELADLSALTLMSPQFTDAGLDNLKGLTNLTMLFLTSSKVSDKGLSSLKSLKNLQVLALSRTEVTDTGLDSLKDLKSLKSIYLIGTKVTPQAVEKLKQAIPGVAVYK